MHIPSGLSRLPATLAMLALLGGQANADIDVERHYLEHCSACHGENRLGGTGPALLPDNLRRLSPDAAATAIRDGLTQTQMPAFGDALDDPTIAALVDYIYAAPAAVPRWGLAEIRDSHQGLDAEPAPQPIHDADPMNLFVVVESGDHHISILDGDSFEVLARLPTRFALHGGPKFSPDGRFVYLASRDGWISKVDLYGLQPLAEIRAGINTRNLALSHDGRMVLVGNYLPHSLVALDAEDLSPIAVVEVEGLLERRSSRVSAVYLAPPRESFIVALKDVAEIWEIPYGSKGRAATSGLVHSHEQGREEAVIAEAGPLPIRRILLKEPLDDFFFDPDYRILLGSARDGGRALAVHLDVGRVIGEVPLPGLPHLGSGTAWSLEGRRVMATPHLREAAVSVIDIDRLEIVDRIDTLGPGFFLRSHPQSRHAWVDVYFGSERDAVQVIDKQSLEIVASLVPSPGQTAAHTEYTRDGRYTLVSIWEDDGALVIYDDETLQEVKRLPMRKPSGKYNVYNRLHLSAGSD